MGRKIAWVGEDFATFYELLAPSALDQRLHLARLNEAEGIKERPSEPRYFVKYLQMRDCSRALISVETLQRLQPVFRRHVVGERQRNAEAVLRGNAREQGC